MPIAILYFDRDRIRDQEFNKFGDSSDQLVFSFRKSIIVIYIPA